MSARTLIQKLTPDGVVTVLDRPTITTGSLGEPGLSPPKATTKGPKPPTVEVVPPKKATS